MLTLIKKHLGWLQVKCQDWDTVFIVPNEETSFWVKNFSCKEQHASFYQPNLRIYYDFNLGPLGRIHSGNKLFLFEQFVCIKFQLTQEQ